MDKHAYLIIAHNEFGLLKKIVELLDDCRNDIYIHIDKKVLERQVPKLSTQNAGLYFVKRRKVTWGGDNMIRCELELLKKATQKYHSYYHLISGVDLPIKSQEYIHNYFKKNKGKNFFDIDKKAIESGAALERIKYYYLLQNKIGRNRGKYVRILEICENYFLKIQKKLKIDRTKKYEDKVCKGGQWFRITNELAKYIVSCEKKIKKYFKFSICADEVFLQTIALNSKFSDTFTNDSLRCIDWERGKPYTYRLEDYDLIMESDKLFARKFSEITDSEIVNRIYNDLKFNR